MGRSFLPADENPATASILSYPQRAAGLDRSECVLLIAIRWWVATFRQGEDPMPRLHQGLEIAGAREAAQSVDALMGTVARTARRPIDIHGPRCPGLFADEQQLLHAASLTQAGESALAERSLCRALLSSQGAAYALGPLEGLSAAFTDARLFLRRRRLPADDLSGSGMTQAWMSAVPGETLH